MSFQRMGGPNKKKKIPSRRKPVWDDSVNDLTVYRATPHEVLLRKESHKSKNHMSVKLEKMRSEGKKNVLSGADLQKLAIMKEVLYDQHQLQQVLAKSDSMMAVVKDLFGDDPKRSVGFPNVTIAPQAESASSSLVRPIPEFYTRSEKMSDSVMGQSAINDVDITDSEDEDEDDDEIDRPEPISYKSKLNLQHFQEYLQEEERKVDHVNPDTLVSVSQQQNTNSSNMHSKQVSDDLERVKLLQTLLEHGKLDPELIQNPQHLAFLLANLSGPQNGSSSSSEFKTPPRNSQPPPVSQGSAMNDTQKVKKTKKQTTAQSPPQDSHTNANLTMSDMRQALKDLETELASYEHQTGRLPKDDVNKTESFSGYTVALVGTVYRLTKYLKETDMRVRVEVTLREQLTQDVYQLRAIIDALASDLIMTQEEYAKLFSENQRYKETTAAEIANMNKQIVELQTIVVSGHLPKPASNSSGFGEKMNVSRKSEESRTSTPNHSLTAQAQASASASSSGAVLLSPVIRKTRVHSHNNNSNSNSNTGLPSKRQTSLVDVSDLAVSSSSHSSDPPQLTQAPPVMKSISVPRPISLVQSNLPVPLTSSLPASTATVGESIVSGREGQERQEAVLRLQEVTVEDALQDPALQDLMQIQIAELNRQQEEAKKRLRDLLANQKIQQQQLQQHLGPDFLVDGDNSPPTPRHWQQDGQTVSPPISPISSHSDRPALRDMENLPQVALSTKGISLTLPKADLDVSAGSLSSPPRGQGQGIKLDE